MTTSQVLAQSVTPEGSQSGLGAVIFLALIAYVVYRLVGKNPSEQELFESLSPSVRHVVSRFDPQSRMAFFEEYSKARKKTGVAWIAWFLIGWHYLYVGKVGVQFAFWVTFGGLLVWWFVDFFRMPAIVKSANDQIARNMIQTLGLAGAFPHTFPDVGTTS